jgi:hypothetical protein
VYLPRETIVAVFVAREQVGAVFKSNKAQWPVVLTLVTGINETDPEEKVRYREFARLD